MEPLSPFVALAGGALIGASAALLLVLSGRIAGISGLVARATGIASSRAPPEARRSPSSSPCRSARGSWGVRSPSRGDRHLLDPAAHFGWSPRRLRDAAGQRLHKRARGLRIGADLAPVDRRHCRVHPRRLRNDHRRPPRDRSLRPCAISLPQS